MARSSYVYVVVDHAADHTAVLAGFTVKYELRRWLRDRVRDGEKLDDLTVTRMRDGGRGDVHAIDAQAVHDEQTGERS